MDVVFAWRHTFPERPALAQSPFEVFNELCQQLLRNLETTVRLPHPKKLYELSDHLVPHRLRGSSESHVQSV